MEGDWGYEGPLGTKGATKKKKKKKKKWSYPIFKLNLLISYDSLLALAATAVEFF